jgi:hypothetical protein
MVFPLIILMVSLLIAYAEKSCGYAVSQSDAHVEERAKLIEDENLNSGETKFAREADFALELLK